MPLADASNRLKDVLEREQVEENLRFARSASIAGALNGAVAVIAMWDRAIALPLLCWLIAVIVGALMRLHNMLAQPGDANAPEKVQQQIRWIDAVALFNGICWGLGVALASAVVDPASYILVIILCSGMMGASVTTYASMSRAAISFLVPLAAGGLYALWAQPYAPSIAGTVLLGCYSVLLFNGAIERQTRFLERVAARERMRENAATVRLLLNDFEAQTADWLWRLDAQQRIFEPATRFAEAAYYKIGELHGTPLLNLFAPSPEYAELEAHLRNGTSFRDLTLRLAKGGEARWWKLSGRPTRQGGMRGVASDVTAQKRAEERVQYMAHYDELTQLANRFLFHEDLQRTLRRRVGDDQVAVLCLDLDSFKSVNDTLGHPAGDALLAETAKRIQNAVRQQDLVARLGGDEFAVLVRGKHAARDAQRIARRILSAIVEPVMVHGTQVITSTSIGLATADAGARDADALMRRADLALYAAKGAGRNRFAIFEPGMDRHARERRELEMDLRSALVRGEFELYYQPLINIENEQTVGYEALIRWHHPQRGTVRPDDFVPLAEETGLIVQIGEWVIRQACAELAAWPEHLRVSVNLSPAQMRGTSLVPTIVSAIATSGISPGRLELEITENVLLHDSEANLAILHQLREMGVRIALDDFGTGYSSLNYLRSFPFDKIKIDKCFVGDLSTNPDSLAIVRAVMALASSMGMETTAEGVELPHQLELLREEGCTQAQGYLFSQPERADQFTDLRVGRPVSVASLPAPAAPPDRGTARMPGEADRRRA